MADPKPFEMNIELGKVREFARAVGSTHPQHLDRESAVSPVTFLMSSQFWQGPENSAMPADRKPERILHGSQEFVFPKGPPKIGTHLTGISSVENEYTKSGSRGGEMRFTTLLTEYRNDAGEVVAEVRNTLIETSKATGSDA